MSTLKRGMGAVIIGIAFLLINCAEETPTTTINMQPFIAMAKGVTTCIEKANKLYAIDDSMVFWQREGNCNDAAYTYILYGRDTGIVHCRAADIGGGGPCACPSSCACSDSTFSLLFCTIINNLNDTKLGLGSAHSVIRVYF